MLVAAYIFRRHTVFLQIAANDFSDMVAAHLRHHGARHASPSEGDNTIESRATRNGFLWLVVLKQNVQYRFSYTYYALFSHKFLYSPP